MCAEMCLKKNAKALESFESILLRSQCIYAGNCNLIRYCIIIVICYSLKQPNISALSRVVGWRIEVGKNKNKMLQKMYRKQFNIFSVQEIGHRDFSTNRIHVNWSEEQKVVRQLSQCRSPITIFSRYPLPAQESIRQWLLPSKLPLNDLFLSFLPIFRWQTKSRQRIKKKLPVSFSPAYNTHVQKITKGNKFSMSQKFKLGKMLISD